MAVLLAVDTSTEIMHLALVIGDAVRTLRRPGGAAASLSVLSAVRELLDEAGLNLTQVDAFGFGRGPGAFTGLRIACAVTQGLALGAGRPVIAVDSLMAVAESAFQEGAGSGATAGLVWAAVDARMGEIYAACYQRVADQGWRTVEAPALRLPAALETRMRDHCRADVAGNAVALWGEVLIPVANAVWPHAEPRGEALAALMRVAHACGSATDPAHAVPLYVRDKVALTLSERVRSRDGDEHQP